MARFLQMPEVLSTSLKLIGWVVLLVLYVTFSVAFVQITDQLGGPSGLLLIFFSLLGACIAYVTHPYYYPLLKKRQETKDSSNTKKKEEIKVSSQ